MREATIQEPPRGTLARRLRLGRSQLAAFRPSWGWARSVVRSFVTSFLALAASLQLLPGTQATRGVESVASLAILALLVGALLRPLITRLTVLTGAVGLLIAGVLAQAAVLEVALALVPTVEPFSWNQVILASWTAAVASAIVNWLLDTSSDEVFLGQLLGRAVRNTRHAGSEGPGLLVVQLDGVSEPLLRQAITSGAMPTVSRLIRSGSHDLRCWHTGTPATTPAGQAVLLHGDATQVPAFRWWDREVGRQLVASKPADVAETERALSDGRGLLADGGTSISNIFSGDAPTKLLTVSDIRPPGGDRGAASFAVGRVGFLRSVTLFVGQMVTEWHQARRQRIRNVVPRVSRGGTFILLRGLTTVLLRDLNVSMVADQLMRGTPVVYVDFVDYDEVAHHAGPTRPESMRTLENLDRILHFLDLLTREVGRHYEIAIVSDHGQTQGSTFLQLAGETLEDVVRGLTAPSPRTPQPVASATTATPPDGGRHGRDRAGETWMPATMLLAGAAGSGRLVTRAAHSVARRRGPAEVAEEETELLVAASGSLAHVYRTDLAERASAELLEQLHPGLVAGLVAHPHVGFVMTRDRHGEVVVQSDTGCRTLRADGLGGVEVSDARGEDPLAAYGPYAAADVLGLDGKRHVGDVVVFGRFDPALGEVVAFEELVGSHGGLGGWQTEAFLVHPHGWRIGTGTLSGGEVHAAIVGRLEELGLRRTTGALVGEPRG